MEDHTGPNTVQEVRLSLNSHRYLHLPEKSANNYYVDPPKTKTSTKNGQIVKKAINLPQQIQEQLYLVCILIHLNLIDNCFLQVPLTMNLPDSRRRTHHKTRVHCLLDKMNSFQQTLHWQYSLKRSMRQGKLDDLHTHKEIWILRSNPQECKDIVVHESLGLLIREHLFDQHSEPKLRNQPSVS